MLWRIRTGIADRPGALAELAVRCGAAGINILSLEVFAAETGAVDELVLSTGPAWTAGELIALARAAGCGRTTAKPCRADSLTDAPTRYLRAVLRMIDDPCSADEELERLQGLDEYTPAEWARADALVEIAARLAERHDSGSDGRHPDGAAVPRPGDPHPRDAAPESGGPSPGGAVPALRKATVADARALVAMHDRCSSQTRIRRYHGPMPRLTERSARRLSAPTGGISVAAYVGDAMVGMATAAPWDELTCGEFTVMEVAVLVEDGWQRRGIGGSLLARVVAEARSLGADRIVCRVQPDNAAILRTVEGLRMRTRVVPDGGQLLMTVALSDQSLSHAADRSPVAYRRSRGIDTHRGQAASRAVGASTDQHPLPGTGTVPALPDRARTAGVHGADRGVRP